MCAESFPTSRKNRVQCTPNLEFLHWEDVPAEQLQKIAYLTLAGDQKHPLQTHMLRLHPKRDYQGSGYFEPN